ncbi:hypothetical protein GW17_00040543 [Ensete ventricosum]|nr:hypothetical protein GW17_00040543 [Ensete ventricosum]
MRHNYDRNPRQGTENIYIYIILSHRRIAGFAPEFTLSAKSPDLRPRSPSRPNLWICARVHPLGQISGFAPDFTLSAKSPDLRPSSPSRPNLRICARVHPLGQISGFAPEFSLSAKSPDLCPSSLSRPNLRIYARVHPLGQISGFVPEFTLSAKFQDLRPRSPLQPDLKIGARLHPWLRHYIPELVLDRINSGCITIPELMLGRIYSCCTTFPSSCSVRSTQDASQFPSSCSVGSTLAARHSRAHARSDQLRMHHNSRAHARSDLLLLDCIPELMLGRINSGYATTPELTLGRIYSCCTAFPSSCSVGSTHDTPQPPSPRSVRPNLATSQFLSSRSVGSTTTSFEVPKGPHSGLVQGNLEPTVKYKTSSSAPSSGASRRSTWGGKNDMTNANLAAKSPHPRTTGPPTWPT